MTEYFPLIFLWIVILLMLSDRKKKRRRRKKNRTHERSKEMNELMQTFIGKRCEIHGDLGIATLVTITAVKDDWIEATDEKGKKRLFNAAYISEIREMPSKEKKPKT